MLHFKQKRSVISYLQTCNINLDFLSLVYSSTNKGTSGKSNTSVVHGLHTFQLILLCLTEICLSISIGSFVALNSQSNAISSNKNEPVWRSRQVLDAMFFTRGHKLLSLVPSFPQLLFCHAIIRESRRLFYLCMGVFFFNPKINSMHTSYMYERCKMFVLFELSFSLKKFENAVLHFNEI